MRIFLKLSRSLQQVVINQMEKGILVNFLDILFVSSFTTNSTRFSNFDIRNMILFQMKVFGRNIKETTLARYFIKVTARPSFKQLRVIRQRDRVHLISKCKISYKDSVVSPSYLTLLDKRIARFSLQKLQRRKRYAVVSGLILHEKRGFNLSLTIWLNFCSHK